MTIKTKSLFLGTGIVLVTASVIFFNTTTTEKSVITSPDTAETTPYTEFEQRAVEIIMDQNGEIVVPEEESLMDYASMSIDTLKKILFPSDDPAWKWAQVDMEGLQEEMPDNLYWELASPTQDEQVLEYRKETKAYWEKEWGQINSNNAPEEQIRAYYAHQHKVSTDYVLFSNRMLEKYHTMLPEKDVSFQKLARNLNLAKLEELPRKLARSLELREQQVQRREEWLADKETFEANLQAEKEDAERLL